MMEKTIMEIPGRRRVVDSGLYGNYIKVAEDQIPRAKEEMLENLINTIRELAKREDFFIVKHPEDFDNGHLIRDPELKPFLEKSQVTVGWKIYVPTLRQEAATDEDQDK